MKSLESRFREKVIVTYWQLGYGWVKNWIIDNQSRYLLLNR